MDHYRIAKQLVTKRLQGRIEGSAFSDEDIYNHTSAGPLDAEDRAAVRRQAQDIWNLVLGYVERLEPRWYSVHMDRDIVAPSTDYTKPEAGDPVFVTYMTQAGYASLIRSTHGVGYDDVTMTFTDREAALKFAKTMDEILPPPTDAYRMAYCDGFKDLKHTTITVSNTEDLAGVLTANTPYSLEVV